MLQQQYPAFMLDGKHSGLVAVASRGIVCGMSLMKKMAVGVGLLALCLGLFSLVSSCAAFNSWRGEVNGRADAQKDLKAGKLILETMGPPPAPWEQTYEKLLKERHGITYSWVAGCIVNDRVSGHARAYNEVMEAEIERRFGKDVLEKTAEEARKQTPAPVR